MGLARSVAATFGAIYLVFGLIGFVLPSPLLGLFPVNGIHNIVHILLGAILLYGAMSTPAALLATRIVGAVLVVLGIAGFPFADGFGLAPLGGNDIWLHLATGVILLGAGFMDTADEGAAA